MARKHTRTGKRGRALRHHGSARWRYRREQSEAAVEPHESFRRWYGFVKGDRQASRPGDGKQRHSPSAPRKQMEPSQGCECAQYQLPGAHLQDSGGWIGAKTSPEECGGAARTKPGQDPGGIARRQNAVRDASPLSTFPHQTTGDTGRVDRTPLGKVFPSRLLGFGGPRVPRVLEHPSKAFIAGILGKTLVASL